MSCMPLPQCIHAFESHLADFAELAILRVICTNAVDLFHVNAGDMMECDFDRTAYDGFVTSLVGS